MQRHYAMLRPIVVSTLLVVLGSSAARAEQLAASPDEAARREKLAERDRYDRALRTHLTNGQWSEAIDTGQKMMAIERQVLGAEHLDTDGSRRWLAELYALTGDFDSASRLIDESTSVQTKAHGADDWRVQSAKDAANYVKQLQALSADERDELQKATSASYRALALYRASQAKEGLELARTGADAYRKRIAEPVATTAERWMWLSYLQSALDQHAEATKSLEQAVEIYQKALPADHPDLATCLQYLANELRLQDKLDESLVHYRKAWNIREQTLGADHVDTKNSAAQLIFAAGQRAGQLEDGDELAAALAARQEAFDVASRIYPDGDWRLVDARSALEGSRQLDKLTPAQRKRLVEVRALHQKCSDQYRASNYQAALPLGQQALAARREILGPRHTDTASSENIVGLVYGASNDLEQAESHLKSAIEAWRAAKGDNHPDVALAMVNLGETYEDFGNLQQAVAYVRPGLKIREQSYGADHAQTTAAVRSLARILGKMANVAEGKRDLAAAEAARDEALQLVLRLYDPQYWTVTDARLALALSRRFKQLSDAQWSQALESNQQLDQVSELLKQNKPHDAVPLAAKAYQTRLAILGPDNTSTYYSIGWLIAATYRDGNQDETVKLANQQRDAAERIFGARHPQFAGALETLAYLSLSQKDLQPAAENYRHAYTIRSEAQSLQNSETQSAANSLINVLGQMADAALAQDDFDAARVPLTEVVALQTALHGADHWQTADARWALANNDELAKLDLAQREGLKLADASYAEAAQLAEQKKYVAAVSAAERAAEMRKESLGAAHRQTVLAVHRVGMLTHARGDTLQALKILVANIAPLRTAYGDANPALAQMLSAIADVYLARKDDTDAAILLRQSLDVSTKALGAQHKDTAGSAEKLLAVLSRLADAQESKPDMAAANKTRQDILAIRIQLLGESHWQVNDARWDLYRTQLLPTLRPDQRQQLTEAAQQLTQSAKQLDAAEPPEDAPQVEVSSDERAQRVAAALNAASQALKLRRQVLGESHPRTADAFEAVGRAQAFAGDSTAARASYDQALAIRKKAQGEKHPSCANNRAARVTAMVQAAAVPFERPSKLTPEQQKRLALRNRYEAAANESRKQQDVDSELQHVQSMLQIEREVLGEVHEETAGSYKRLAQIASNQGDINTQRGYLARLADIYGKLYGPESWQAKEARADAADLEFLTKIDDAQRQRLVEAFGMPQRIKKAREDKKLTVDQAIAAAERMRRTLLDLFGEDRFDYVSCLRSLAELYRQKGDQDDANALSLKAAEITGRIYGKKHPVYQSQMNECANYYLEEAQQQEGIDDFQGAAQNWKKHLEIQTLHYGPRHWRVSDARLNLTRAQRLAKLTPAQRHNVHDVLRSATRFGPPPEPPQMVDSSGKLPPRDEDPELTRLTKQLQTALKVLGEEDPYTIDLFGQVGLAYRNRGQSQKALEALQRQVELSRKVLGAAHPETARSANTLGLVYYQRADYVQAEPLLREARQILETLGRKHDPAYAASLNNLAVLYEALGDYDRAEALLRSVLNMNLPGPGTLDDDADEEEIQDWSKNYDVLLAQFDMTPVIFDGNARAQAPRQPELPDLAQFVNNLALVYQLRGDPAHAESLLRQSLGLIRADRRRLGSKEPATLGNLAAVCQLAGDYEQAEALLEAVLQMLAKSSTQDARYAIALSNLGSVRFQRGDYAGAGELWRQALQIQRDRLGDRHPRTILAMAHLALLADREGRTPEAAAQMDRVLELSEEGLQLVASIQSERQQLLLLNVVRGYLDECLTLTTHADLPADEVYRHVLAWKGMVSTRQRRVRGLRQLAEAQNNPAVGKVYDELTVTNRRLSKLSIESTDSYSADDAKRKRDEIATLALRKDELERDLARQSTQFNQWMKGQQLTVDELKARLPDKSALVDLIEYWQITISGGQKKRQRHVAAFIVKPRGETVRRELGPADAIDKLVDECREFWIRGRRSPDRDPPAELRKAVWDPLAADVAGAETVLVSPDGVMGRIPLGALPGDKPESYLIEQLSIAVVPVPQSIGESPSAGASAKSAAAPGLVLLGNVDFESEPGGESSAAERPAAAARGDTTHKFAALPGTEREIDALKKLYAAQFKKGPLKDLERQEATEAAFRQSVPGAQYVHLATHGFFAPPNFKADDAQAADPLAVDLDQSGQVAGWNPGLLSGIVLAGANRSADYKQDDGILTAAEVADLDLSSARLVVLSACETGLGQIAGGEGALGLQRAFQIAGARAVVSSLWKVDDAATQLLMTQFYENLWRKGMPTLAAFRQAQLSLLRGTIDTSALRGLDIDGDDKPRGSKNGRLSPRLWAAFVISGNPQ